MENASGIALGNIIFGNTRRKKSLESSIIKLLFLKQLNMKHAQWCIIPVKFGIKCESHSVLVSGHKFMGPHHIITSEYLL